MNWVELANHELADMSTTFYGEAPQGAAPGNRSAVLHTK